MYDLIDDGGQDVHGRCGRPDGVCACPDSSFNRWKSGFLDWASLKGEGWSDAQIAEYAAAYSGYPQYRQLKP
jgi:hypothetical protein